MNYTNKKLLKHQIKYRLVHRKLNPDGLYSSIPSIQEYAEGEIKKLRLDAPETPPTHSTLLSQEPMAITNSQFSTPDPPIHPMDEIISKRIEIMYEPIHLAIPIFILHLHKNNPHIPIQIIP